MNKQQRFDRQCDEAAAQAHIEGVSSFGMMPDFKESALNIYVHAAEARGMTFILDEQGIGLFVDDSCIDQYR